MRILVVAAVITHRFLPFARFNRFNFFAFRTARVVVLLASISSRTLRWSNISCSLAVSVSPQVMVDLPLGAP
jgi:hypothetical protein